MTKPVLGTVTEIVQDLAYMLDSYLRQPSAAAAVVAFEGFAAVAAGPSAAVAVAEAAA